MLQKDLQYQIALRLVPQIGDIHAKILVEVFGSAEDVFKAKKKDLEKIEGIGEVRANNIKNFNNFSNIDTEINFIEKYKIQPLFFTDEAYPKRLLNCYDSPILLYYRGNISLNSHKVVAIVGTRNHTDYGRQITEELIESLSVEQVLIVSGLAFGIDTLAHKAAIKNQLPTVGVLAHGLDRIYPNQNKSLARQMIEHGGLLTEYLSNTNPDKQNFPKRNRIVAGLCDALVVVESGKKGGSLITAELANGYNKDVFAIPGRSTDVKSEGCNYLIKNNKAALVNNGHDILEMMNWSAVKKAPKKQRELFLQFSPDEQVIVDLLQLNASVHIDDLYFKSGLSSSAVAAALLMLEMEQVIQVLPGKMYKLL